MGVPSLSTNYSNAALTTQRSELVAPEVAQINGTESAAAEISLMLRVAPVTATSRLDDALTLTGRFPAAVTALAAGRITLALTDRFLPAVTVVL